MNAHTLHAVVRRPANALRRTRRWPVLLGLAGLLTVSLALLLHVGPVWMMLCALLPGLGLGLEISR
ncbi:hypothetical protein [Oleiagrimonas soli]|uniref:Uncharacterized protein n=1 Tax=Oleiagrimonas soli TaxID=1543381 RepID=A0A099CZN8_9GAMM|nr:hypothetical protein [Oleiagrimonas soli]KGI79156.1 hypothetical protein LF63_0100455 [Oleiagrimonas soli]MBB6184810.1 hypothetical protein [Oleiagrimonas soli]